MIIESILYIFKKDDKFMVLNHKDALSFQQEAEFKDWTHINTIDPEAWFMSALNSSDPLTQIDKLKR